MPKYKAILETPNKKLVYEVIAKKFRNTITYQERDDLDTLVKYHYNMQALERQNKDLHLVYLFRENYETRGLIEIKDLAKKVEVLITTKKITQEKNNVYIDFSVNGTSFHYSLEEDKNESN